MLNKRRNLCKEQKHLSVDCLNQSPASRLAHVLDKTHRYIAKCPKYPCERVFGRLQRVIRKKAHRILAADPLKELKSTVRGSCIRLKYLETD
jgi:hypothetical protein